MIKASDTIENLLEKHPEINHLLMKRDIACIRCGQPVWDTIGDLLKQKGLDVDQTLAELNAELGSSDK
jgi:hypothetical protein